MELPHRGSIMDMAENKVSLADQGSQSNSDLEKSMHSSAPDVNNVKKFSENNEVAKLCQHEGGSVEMKELDEGLPDAELNKQQMNVSPTAPDGGWGWIIVGCAFCITAIIGGSYTSFALLYMEFTMAFNASKAVAGWIGSIYMATGQFLGIFFSYAVQRYGSRIVCITGSLVTCVGLLISSFVTSILQLYIFYGFIAGSGVGMIVLSTLVLVQQYFDRRRAMAAGIAVSGYSFGSLVAGPVVRVLIDAYSWRGTLMLIAGIFLHVAVFGSLFRPLVERKKSVYPQRENINGIRTSSSAAANENDEESNGRVFKEPSSVTAAVASSSRSLRKQSCIGGLCSKIFASAFDFSLLRNASFSLYIVSVFFVHVGLTTFNQHTPSRAAHWGVSRNLVAVLPTITGISIGVSRIIFGFVANAPRFVNRMLQYAATALLGGAVQMSVALATSFETMAAYCVVQGVLSGGFLAILTTLLVDLNGVANIARSVSIWSLSVGTGMLFSVPFAGFLYDSTLNYNIPFLVTGMMQAIGGLLGFVIYLVIRCRRTRLH